MRILGVYDYRFKIKACEKFYHRHITDIGVEVCARRVLTSEDKYFSNNAEFRQVSEPARFREDLFASGSEDNLIFSHEVTPQNSKSIIDRRFEGSAR
jgi:hypothetical protein